MDWTHMSKFNPVKVIWNVYIVLRKYETDAYTHSSKEKLTLVYTRSTSELLAYNYQ